MAREALIIATGRYEDPGLSQLRSPAQDAASLGGVLSDERIGGFGVQKVIDGTEAAIRRAIHGFFADRSRDDLLLLHLSCHGIKDDEGRLYFAGTDTTREALEVTGVSSAFLNDQMDRCRARSILLLLDCCYAGAFAAGSKGDGGVHLREKFDGHGRAVLTASNAIEYSWEGDALSGQGRPSVFTAAIVEGLRTGAADRDGDGLVSLPELHDYVTERMLARVPKQTPLRWELGIEGGLYIARNPRPTLPQEILDAIDHPLTGFRVAAVSELARLLDDGPGVSREARRALERMQDDDSLKVRQAAAAALKGSPARPDIDETAASETDEGDEGDEDVIVTPPPDRRRAAVLLGALRNRRTLVGGAVAFVVLVVVALTLVGDTDTVVVSPRTPWTDTGVDVEVGDQVAITATGRVCDDTSRPEQCFGPDGEPDTDGYHSGDPFDANHAALVATTRPEHGTVFEIGRQSSFVVLEEGRLLLGVNDGRLDDNAGSYEATVTVTGPGR